jgi:glycosyltransferase involved in cell wall biosynthesis
MKILQVHNHYQYPGGEDVVFEQERRMLEQAGHEVVVYRRSNLEINRLSWFKRAILPKQIIWSRDTEGEIARLLSKETPDLVHVHNTFLMISPSVYGACRDRGIPVVQTLHNYRLLCPAASFFREGNICEECVEHGLGRGIWHGCYRESRPQTASVSLMLAVHRLSGTWNELVDCYIALTEFSRDKFIAGGLPANKIFVKPNFVNPDPGERQQAGNYALFVGRLSPEKGVSTLLKSWERLSGGPTLHIVGEGPEQERLAAQASKSGLSGVTFRGRLSREETIAAVRSSRFLVVPSEWYEGFPMCIAEAMACGTPVVCSRLGGMAEVVDELRTGLHFTPGDPADLAAKVDWAWSHPKEMEAMGRSGRAEYEAKYTAERNYPMLMDIYQHAIECCHRN